MNNEDNGNLAAACSGSAFLKPTSSSTEDLSEYTDADESISAPTEFLAEFLSAVMTNDYVTALKYCKLILQYEPNNTTAKEFYPLIVEKLNKLNYNKNHGDNNEDEDSTSSSGGGDSEKSSVDNESSSSNDSSEDSEAEEEESEEEEEEEGSSDPADKKSSSDGDATTASYSSLEDEEAEADQLNNLAAKFRIDNVDLGNGNKIICDANGSKLWEANPKQDNSTYGIPFGTSSDSESPTEPISQQTIALLRAKVVPPRL